MKSNRKFVEEEEAVSAVIGVILMVAITVAIAATVYVYVSGMITGGAEDTPDFSFMQDKSGGTITVVTVSENTSWYTMQIVGSATFDKAADPWVTPGDRLTACSGIVSISYDNSTLLGTWDFS